MNEIYCKNCGVAFENLDLVLEFNEDFFCDEDCLCEYVLRHSTDVLITDDYRY